MIACFTGQKCLSGPPHQLADWRGEQHLWCRRRVGNQAGSEKRKPVKVTVAVATVVIFGTIAIFLYRQCIRWLAHWFSLETYGIYIGSTMHCRKAVQVVAADTLH